MSIEDGARKCINCDTWQNWRGHLNFSVPVLTLLLSILTIGLTAGRELYKEITWKPEVAIISSALRGAAANSREFNYLLVEIRNFEDVDVDVSQVSCRSKIKNNHAGEPQSWSLELGFAVNHNPSRSRSITVKSQTSNVHEIELRGQIGEVPDINDILETVPVVCIATFYVRTDKYEIGFEPYIRSI